KEASLPQRTPPTHNNGSGDCDECASIFSLKCEALTDLGHGVHNVRGTALPWLKRQGATKRSCRLPFTILDAEMLMSQEMQKHRPFCLWLQSNKIFRQTGCRAASNRRRRYA